MGCLDAGGVAAISRRSPKAHHRWNAHKKQSSRRDDSITNRQSDSRSFCHPFGMGEVSLTRTGGIASLNHRLMAATPPASRASDVSAAPGMFSGMIGSVQQLPDSN